MTDDERGSTICAQNGTKYRVRSSRDWRWEPNGRLTVCHNRSSLAIWALSVLISPRPKRASSACVKSWRLEAGSWRLGAGGWELEAGSWQLAALVKSRDSFAQVLDVFPQLG